jgi:hypothetical protein
MLVYPPTTLLSLALATISVEAYPVPVISKEDTPTTEIYLLRLFLFLLL